MLLKWKESRYSGRGNERGEYPKVKEILSVGQQFVANRLHNSKLSTSKQFFSMWVKQMVAD